MKQKTQPNQVPTFPVDAFPIAFQAIILECHKQGNYNIDHTSTMVLTTAGALIGNSCKVQIKNTWKENCILWTAIVSESGSMKSPIMNFCTEPLVKLETELAEKHVLKIEEWQQEKDDFASDKSNRGQQFNKPRPRRPDMILSTATIEGVRDAFSRNPRGFILLQDELAAWVKDMTAYSSGSAQEQWLSLQNGKFIKSNTKGDDAVFIANPFVSVSGGIQPSKLNTLSKDGRGDDGSLFRILFSFPDNEPLLPLDDKDIELDTITLYNDLMLRIYSLGNKSFCKEPLDKAFESPNPYGQLEQVIVGAKPDKNGQYLIQLSKEAKNLFYEWNAKITEQINSNLENSTFRSIMKKMEGYIPRIALILQAMYWADSNKDYVFMEVSKEAMTGAIKIIEYFTVTAFKVQNAIKKDSEKESKVKSRLWNVDWNKIFKYIDENGEEQEHEQLKRSAIVPLLMNYGMSETSADRQMEAELSKSKDYGFWSNKKQL